MLFLLAVGETTFNSGCKAGTTVTESITEDGVATEVELHSGESIFGIIVFFAASPVPTLFCACTFIVTLEMLQRSILSWLILYTNDVSVVEFS